MLICETYSGHIGVVSQSSHFYAFGCIEIFVSCYLVSKSNCTVEL